MLSNTEILTDGCKIYIITKTSERTLVTTVGKGSKVEHRTFKSWENVPFDERSRIALARIFNEKRNLRQY